MGDEKRGDEKQPVSDLKGTARALATRKANQLGFKMEVLREAHNMRYPGQFTRAEVAKKIGLSKHKIPMIRDLEEGIGTVRTWFAVCALFEVTPSKFLMAEIGQ